MFTASAGTGKRNSGLFSTSCVNIVPFPQLFYLPRETPRRILEEAASADLKTQVEQSNGIVWHAPKERRFTRYNK